MKLRARLRKIILWSAAISSVLLAVVWIGSVWWKFSFYTSHGGMASINSGRLFVLEYPPFYPGVDGPFDSVSKNLGEFTWWWYSFDTPTARYVSIPLWPFLGITSVITAFAWRKEVIARRRANQHKCPKCNYDRSGLKPDAPCPECSAPPVSQPTA